MDQQSQIAKRWRERLVAKLQGLYGLTKEQAGTKADVWLQWMIPGGGDHSNLRPENLLAREVRDRRVHKAKSGAARV